MIRHGHIESWSDDQQRYVGQPSMNGICHHLLSEISLRTETRVERITRVRDRLLLTCDQGRELGTFDRILISAPAPQTAELLQGVSSLAHSVRKIAMQPCWAVMAELPRPITNAWVGAFVHDSWITWIARNSTKPGREMETEKVVIHLNADWTLKHWESTKEAVAEATLAELFRATSLEPQEPIQLTAHRWSYALASQTDLLEQRYDPAAGIIICGDWTHGSRVEGAFLSGMSAAGRILGSFDENYFINENRQ